MARRSGAADRVAAWGEAPGRPALTFTFHDKATIPSGLVRKDPDPRHGLAEDEALVKDLMETYAEVIKLAEEGVPFAFSHDAALEHFAPAGEHIVA